MEQVSNADVTQAVREAAMLADVTMSMWEATQNDRHLMEGVKRQHNATGDCGRVIKFLMAGADDQLKRTRNAFKAVRNLHRSLTLPWIGDANAQRIEGPRLLPHLLNARYMTEMAAGQKAAYVERDELVVQLPDLIVQAKSHLGSMVTSDSYPTPEEVRGKFRIHFDFEPLPASAMFGGLNDHMLERLSASLNRKQVRQAQAAEAVMWGRVRERVEHLVERLTTDDDSDKAKTFKAATIESVRDLLVLLPGWNVGGNPVADEIADDLDTILKGVTAEDIRNSKTLRTTTAEDTQKLLDKMDQYGF